jgi:prepilin-type N-terminal cleavage/methylation domain-containing protein
MEEEMRNSKGFTLVELAIVLVIIGVILGGVIKGQELVRSSKIKRLYRDFQSVQYAYLTYQEQNNMRLPGDDSNATPAGDGDGIVEGNWNSTATTNTDENGLFWQHLRASNLYPTGQNATEHPRNIFGQVMGIQNNSFTAGNRHHSLCMANLVGADAQLLDNAFDDGFLNSGEIAGANRTGTPVRYVAATTYTVCIRID